MPKVSICIPAYENAVGIGRLLESIFHQSFPDFEIVVTDDSESTDIRRIADRYGSDGRLKYFANPSRLGSPANWNKAISLAMGEYIKIMHHDDWFSDQASLESFVTYLDAHPMANFVFSSSYRAVDGHKTTVFAPSARLVRRIEHDARSLFSSKSIGPPSATMYRRGPGVTFDDRLMWVVDVDFYIRVLAGTKSVGFIPTPLVCVTEGSTQQVSRQCENNQSVDIYENILLYNKVRQSNPCDLRHLPYWVFKLMYYSITSVRELKLLARDQSVPHSLLLALSGSQILCFLRTAKRRACGYSVAYKHRGQSE